MADMDSFFDKQDKKEKKKDKKDKKKKGDDDLDAAMAAELGVGASGGLGIDAEELSKKDKKDKKDKKEKKEKGDKTGDEEKKSGDASPADASSPAASPTSADPPKATKASKIWGGGSAPTADSDAVKKATPEPEDSKPKTYKAPARLKSNEPKVDQSAFSTGLDDLLDADGKVKALPPSSSQNNLASPAGSPNNSGPGAFKPSGGGYRPPGSGSSSGNPNVYRPGGGSRRDYDSPEPSGNPNVYDPRTYRSDREKQKELKEQQTAGGGGGSYKSPAASPNTSSAPGAYRPGQLGGKRAEGIPETAVMKTSPVPAPVMEESKPALPTSGSGYKPGAFKASGITPPKQKEIVVATPLVATPAPVVEPPKLATSSGGFKANTSGSAGAFKASAGPKEGSNTPPPAGGDSKPGAYKPGAYKGPSGGGGDARATGSPAAMTTTTTPSELAPVSTNPNAYKPGNFSKKK